MPIQFESNKRHVRFDILPVGNSENDRLKRQAVREALGISIKTSVQASMTEGIQIGKLAKEMNISFSGKQCVSQLNRFEKEGKIRFREYIARLDAHKFQNA